MNTAQSVERAIQLAQEAVKSDEAGDLDEAISHFERAGDGASNQFSYGITLARMNRLAEARIHLEKSLQADARQPLAHEVLGRLMEAARQIPEAISHYREAIRLQPNFGKAHLDLATVLESVRKTNRCVCVEEGFPQFSVTSEIAAQVMTHAFDYLDAPVARVAGKDVPMPYAANLEKLALPNADEVVAAAKAVLYV